MTSKKTTLIRFVAVVQLMISAVLIGAVLWVYGTYHASYVELSRSLAATMSSTATLIGRVADTLRLRQEILDQTAATLKAGRATVEQVDIAARKLAPRLAQYGAGMLSVATLLERTSGQVDKIGERLLVAVPTGIHMEGRHPTLKYAMPFGGAADALKEHGADLHNIGVTVRDMADAVTRDGPAVNDAFVESTRQTLLLADVTVKALGNMKAQELPKTVNELEAASRQLQAASQQVEAGSRLTVVLVAVGLLVATLFGLNGVGFLLLANALSPHRKVSRSVAEEGDGVPVRLRK